MPTAASGSSEQARHCSSRRRPASPYLGSGILSSTRPATQPRSAADHVADAIQHGEKQSHAFQLQAAVANDIARARKRQCRQCVRRDGGHEHRAQHQLAVCFEHGMEGHHHYDERQRADIPCQPVSRERPHIPTRIDRNLRCCLSRLPHCCGAIPRRQKHQPLGQQFACVLAVRCLRFDQQRGSATEPVECGRGQKMAEMQSQGTLQACLASQTTLANMERRNAERWCAHTAWPYGNWPAFLCSR